jgi:hypothetical protein
MLAYLAYPKPFIKQVNAYANARNIRNKIKELHDVKMLQQSHWLISNIEYFVAQLQAAEHKAQ